MKMWCGIINVMRKLKAILLTGLMFLVSVFGASLFMNNEEAFALQCELIKAPGLQGCKAGTVKSSGENCKDCVSIMPCYSRDKSIVLDQALEWIEILYPGKSPEQIIAGWDGATKSYAQPATTFFDWGETCIGGNNITTAIFIIYNWLSIGVLIAVVAGIIIGAIQYSTAQGDSSKAKEAMVKIRNAALALGLYFLMWALLNFIVPGGLFNDQGELDGLNKSDNSWSRWK